MSRSKLPSKRMSDVIEAIEDLERLLDPDSGCCHEISVKDRKHLGIFIGSWVLPRLRKLRHYGRGGKFSSVNDYMLDADGEHIDEEST